MLLTSSSLSARGVRPRGRGRAGDWASSRIASRGGRISTRLRAVPAAGSSKEFAALEGCEVFRVSDGRRVRLTDAWKEDEKALLAVQLRRDVKPRLDEANVKLLLVSIGTPERGKDFARENDFPEQNLYADPENLCYDALELYGGVARTFFDVRTPFSMRDRFFKDGAKDLVEVLKRWKPWIPPKQSQTVLQGGVACFDGRECTFLHRDPSTGAHADWKSVLRTLGA